jgi:cytochrome c
MRGAAAVAFVIIAAGCGSGTGSEHVAGGDSKLGHTLIEHYGCGGCHRIAGVAHANGRVGPRLTDFRDKRRIADTLPNTPESAARWIQHPDTIKPKADMPNLGVTPGEAKAIVAYLRTQ